MAIAIQNLAWGIGQPIFGAIAEKIGDRKAILIGVFCYAIGLIFSSYAISPGAHQFYSLFVGFGIAGTGFGVILAIVGRATSDANRSMALGIATAFGSVGQIIGPPTAEFRNKSRGTSILFTFCWIWYCWHRLWSNFSHCRTCNIRC
jgi:MFS family permease